MNQFDCPMKDRACTQQSTFLGKIESNFPITGEFRSGLDQNVDGHVECLIIMNGFIVWDMVYTYTYQLNCHLFK